jgi:hypothetical protein
LTVEIPKPVQQFIVAFDGGRFSTLVTAGGWGSDASGGSASRPSGSGSLADDSEL